MFTVTVKYFGSNNTCLRNFAKAEDLYSYLDAVKPFICYSKVADIKNCICLEKHYANVVK